jgi:hypothetical protein
MADCLLTDSDHCSDGSHREFVQANVLDRGPDNREATGLGRKHVNLVGALAHITEQTLNGIGRLNMPMHGLRELVKREGLLFFLGQTSYCLWIALAIFGFEGRQLGRCLLFVRLLPDANEFGLDIATLPSGNGREHVALLVHQTALTRRGRKQVRDRRQQPLVPIGHNEVDLGGSS